MTTTEPTWTLEQEIARCASIVPGPCPSWCNEPAGHPYQSDEALLRVASRTHLLRYPHGVTIEQTEFINFEGVVTLDDSKGGLSLCLYHPVDDLSAGDALNLAAVIREAALELDHITAAQR